MLPAAFVILDALPLTTNGKVDQRALPLPDQTRPELARALVVPRTAVERELAEIFHQVLGLTQVGIHDNFFELGGDSIRSLQVQAKAHASGWHFALPQLFQHQTVAELAQVVSHTTSSPGGEAQTQPFSLLSQEDRSKLPQEVEDAYPLTLFQAEMLLYSQRYPEAAVYHDIFSYHVRARFAIQAWHTAWQRLATRHAVLRTAFDFTSFSEPLQLVHRTVRLPMAAEDLCHLPASQQAAHLVAWREAEKTRHFDWTTPPLLRVQVHGDTADTFWFTLSFHHAILDGWSVASMLTEIWQHYTALLDTRAAPLAPPPGPTFHDFVAQERRVLHSVACQHYWSQKLLGSTMTMLLPDASHRQRIDPPQSCDLEMPVDCQVLVGLQRLARAIAVPLKSVLLAAHLRVVSQLSHQTEVLTGLICHARPEGPEAEQVLGMFLNVVPICVQLPADSWRSLVEEAFKAEQELLLFRHYPIAHFPGSERKLPHFETVFNFIHFHVYQRLKDLNSFSYLGGLFSDPFPYTLKVNFILDPFTSQLRIILNYNYSVLDKEKIKIVGEYLKRSISSMINNENINI
jgi:microcystin synthetase protein McyA